MEESGSISIWKCFTGLHISVSSINGRMLIEVLRIRSSIAHEFCVNFGYRNV